MWFRRLWRRKQNGYPHLVKLEVKPVEPPDISWNNVYTESETEQECPVSCKDCPFGDRPTA